MLVVALTKNTLAAVPLTLKFVLAFPLLIEIVPPAASSLILLPVITMLPCVALPVVEINPPLNKLPPVILAVALTVPVTAVLPLVTVPVPDTPTCKLPLGSNRPSVMLPTPELKN